MNQEEINEFRRAFPVKFSEKRYHKKTKGRKKINQLDHCTKTLASLMTKEEKKEVFFSINFEF